MLNAVDITPNGKFSKTDNAIKKDNQLIKNHKKVLAIIDKCQKINDRVQLYYGKL